jgi:hypothetical protein
MLGQIAHCSYEKSASILTNVFNPITVEYQNLIGQAETNTVNMDSFKEGLELIETKFAWLVYIMATFMGNRLVCAYLILSKWDKLILLNVTFIRQTQIAKTLTTSTVILL